MQPFLEHFNMTSTDVDATIRFLQTAMPEFQVRWRGDDGPNRHWVHLGTETSYIAIEDRGSREVKPRELYEDPGVNHMAFVVQDVIALVKRMQAAGYREGLVDVDHPHRLRYYFYDHDGNEYEFVQYLSDIPNERNDYTL